MARTDRRCDGVLRRDVLRIGALSAFGIGLADLARPRSARASALAPRARSAILIWLDGGPSHLDTFDPKPDAPREVRGPFASIATKVPGLRFSEHLPRTARIADRIAVVRSLTSHLGEHNFASQYILTAHPPSPSLRYPSLGSLVASARPIGGVLPPYVALGDAPNDAAGPGWLGASHGPFVVGGDPAREGFRVRDLEPWPGLDDARLRRRRDYLRALDGFTRSVERAGEQGELDENFERAWRLVASGKAREAFDLSREPDSVRKAYGSRSLGPACLIARRLVERGVPFVTVTDRGWDTHDEGVLRLAEGYTGGDVGKVPVLDTAFSTLLEDLSERGLLDETLVIVAGEFGRTPKVNTRGGRDHWPRVFSAALAGGGIAPGAVVGASDALGESPLDRPIAPPDLGFTVLRLLGIDPEEELRTPDGRPVRRIREGKLIAELIA